MTSSWRLQAAADTFTASGYAKAGLREIGERAGVAPSLVSRYFGTKAALFEAALIHVLRTNSVFTWQKDGFGEAMARLIPERSNTNITVMLVLALADPESKEIARQVSREHMIEPLLGESLEAAKDAVFQDLMHGRSRKRGESGMLLNTTDLPTSRVSRGHRYARTGLGLRCRDTAPPHPPTWDIALRRDR